MQIEKIWNFVDGPYEDPEIEGCYSMICLVEYEDGTTGQQEIYMPDVDGCRDVERYFQTKIEPLTLDQVADLCYPDV